MTAGLIRATSVAMATLMAGLVLMSPSATLAAESPFKGLPGRWTGEGMLGLRESPTEKVKCRATYFLTEGKDEMTQNIRCATAGGSVEIKSAIQNAAGALTGTWQETTRNIGGELTGQAMPSGLKITVKGGDITANMEIVVRDTKQIVEIQFINSALIGLTLILTKG